ncbi:MAG: DUF4097 family beta strand repeat protein [Clostridia bacterium]|nr:DUF4097 family beta strand repeat protein [Clostridia bacterium]
MSKIAKIWLAIASSLVVIGLGAFVVVMSMNDWDFTKISTVKFETNTYEVGEEFSSISINTDTANIEFAPSTDEKCKVVCYEKEKIEHNASVTDGILKIGVTDNRQWYEHIEITFQTQKVTVYLPKSEYSSLTIKEHTGNVNIPSDFKFENIDVSTSTGSVKCFASATEKVKITTTTGAVKVSNATVNALDILVTTGDITVSGVTCANDIKISVVTGNAYLENVTCKKVTSGGSTGDITLKEVVAVEKISVERSTGDVRFNGSDAGEIFVKTSTGNVSGSLLTPKIFDVSTGTGSVSVPHSVTGGKCEIKTSTGNIRMIIAQ